MNTRQFECPKCSEWIDILPTTPEKFDCPWCKAKLEQCVDAEFENGSWHDLTEIREQIEKNTT